MSTPNDFKEKALKVDNGFKINMICLADEATSDKQKLSIARMMKTSLERTQRIIERNANPHLKLTLSVEEQDFINQFLPADEQLKLL